jgi:hypothetical protein
MALSQSPKKYKIYEGDNLPPLYDYIRTLSNGVHICANDDESLIDETAMNLEQIEEYIKNNHIDIIEE